MAHAAAGAGLLQLAEHDALVVRPRRSRSSSRDDKQTLIIENTFFRLVGGDDARSATPPGRRRRARSLPSLDRAAYMPLDAPCPSQEDEGHRRYCSRPGQAEAEIEGDGLLAVVQETEEQCEVAEVLTTVVIRNMPQAYTRDMLLELLDSEGFQNQYDFVYLPLDFNKSCSFGYAFVNMVSPHAAQRFHEVFAGFSRWSVPHDVPWDEEAEVGWATLQGLEKHVDKYRNSPVMHENVDNEARPILLKDGQRVAFPSPTKKIGLVKRLRTRRRSTDGETLAWRHDTDTDGASTATAESFSPTRGKTSFSPTKARFGGAAHPLPLNSMVQSPLLAGLYATPSPPQRHERAAPTTFGPPGHFGHTQTGPPLLGSSGSLSDASSRTPNWAQFVGRQGPMSSSSIGKLSDASTREPTSPHRRGRSDASKQLSSSGGGSSGKPPSLLANLLVPVAAQPPPQWSPYSTQPYGASQSGWARVIA